MTLDIAKDKLLPQAYGIGIFSQFIHNYIIPIQKSKLPMIAKEKPSEEFSIDDIVESESQALLDKAMNSALAIVSRLNIHKQFDYELTQDLLEIGTDLLNHGRLCVNFQDYQKNKIKISSELLSLNKQKREAQVQLWQDLQLPMENFINHFHKFKEIKSDLKLIQ
jgi:hypothetical protein